MLSEHSSPAELGGEQGRRPNDESIVNSADVPAPTIPLLAHRTTERAWRVRHSPWMAKQGSNSITDHVKLG